ncbi:MAG: hypothetical protein F6K14_07515 [Symploca sp. SIO2C1]|nr:hypothetical protein [Symploca sp. SIO2C1]
MKIKYLLDEHIASLYRTQLMRQAPYLVVRMIGDPDAPSKGTLDPGIRAYPSSIGDYLMYLWEQYSFAHSTRL